MDRPFFMRLWSVARSQDLTPTVPCKLEMGIILQSKQASSPFRISGKSMWQPGVKGRLWHYTGIIFCSRIKERIAYYSIWGGLATLPICLPGKANRWDYKPLLQIPALQTP